MILSWGCCSIIQFIVMILRRLLPGSSSQDGLTRNMLENTHAHWKRNKVCKIRRKGVCIVDLYNVCQQLEDKYYSARSHGCWEQIMVCFWWPGYEQANSWRSTFCTTVCWWWWMTQFPTREIRKNIMHVISISKSFYSYYLWNLHPEETNHFFLHDLTRNYTVTLTCLMALLFMPNLKAITNIGEMEHAEKLGSFPL